MTLCAQVVDSMLMVSGAIGYIVSIYRGNQHVNRACSVTYN
jgi:hypothetical protein